MANSRRRYRMLAMQNGLVVIRKQCGFCRRSHIVEFPLDDLHVPRRMTSLCDRCSLELEQAIERFPELRGRRKC